VEGCAVYSALHMKRFDLPTIEATLNTRVFGRELLYLPSTGSTNDVAKALAAQGAPAGTVVLAEAQTAGRGRMGRRWFAPPGACLLCSILFRPDLPPTQTPRLTMLCALATADAVEAGGGLRVWLKWPNDLVVESRIPHPASRNWRKLAGVLTETGVMGERLDFVVVGIGVNVNVEPEVLPTLAPDATSILAEVMRPVDRLALLATFLAGVERRYEALRAGESPHREWAARLATLGQPARVTTSEGVLTGVAESVDEDGALLLRTPDGELRRLLAGDVTLARLGCIDEDRPRSVS
jgi:BirA family biotin operon repressor/biotin-[acetyl-CoA-carboxylase] ligase